MKNHFFMTFYFLIFIKLQQKYSYVMKCGLLFRSEVLVQMIYLHFKDVPNYFGDMEITGGLYFLLTQYFSHLKSYRYLLSKI